MKIPISKIDPLLNSASFYFHFPFCRSKCHYCAFLSHPNQTPAQIEKQLDQTASLAEDFFKEFPALRPTSIYFGGGTPSLVPVNILREWCKRVFSGVERDNEIEWTLEANCRDITKENLAEWASIGINRISLGIQSLRQEILDSVGRDVTTKEQQTSLELLSSYWTGELKLKWSIDLIAGLPGYSNKMFIEDLNNLVSFDRYNFGHISIYDLILEEGTPLFERYHKKGQNDFPCDDDLADLWDSIKEILNKKGFSRYEISNFAKPGEESIHNRQYWEMKPYLGLGEGAVSMLPGPPSDSKDSDKSRNDVFRMTCKAGGVFDIEEIPRVTYQKECLMMGLRDRQGMDLLCFEEIFGEPVETLIPQTLNRYGDLFVFNNSTGFDNVGGKRLSLSDKGLDILNSILISVFEELDK